MNFQLIYDWYNLTSQKNHVFFYLCTFYHLLHKQAIHETIKIDVQVFLLKPNTLYMKLFLLHRNHT